MVKTEILLLLVFHIEGALSRPSSPAARVVTASTTLQSIDTRDFSCKASDSCRWLIQSARPSFKNVLRILVTSSLERSIFECGSWSSILVFEGANESYAEAAGHCREWGLEFRVQGGHALVVVTPMADAAKEYAVIQYYVLSSRNRRKKRLSGLRGKVSTAYRTFRATLGEQEMDSRNFTCSTQKNGRCEFAFIAPKLTSQVRLSLHHVLLGFKQGDICPDEEVIYANMDPDLGIERLDIICGSDNVELVSRRNWMTLTYIPQPSKFTVQGFLATYRSFQPPVDHSEFPEDDIIYLSKDPTYVAVLFIGILCIIGMMFFQMLLPPFWFRETSAYTYRGNRPILTSCPNRMPKARDLAGAHTSLVEKELGRRFLSRMFRPKNPDMERIKAEAAAFFDNETNFRGSGRSMSCPNLVNVPEESRLRLLETSMLSERELSHRCSSMTELRDLEQCPIKICRIKLYDTMAETKAHLRRAAVSTDLRNLQNLPLRRPAPWERVDPSKAGPFVVRTLSGRAFQAYNVRHLPRLSDGNILIPLEPWKIKRTPSGRIPYPLDKSSVRMNPQGGPLIPLERSQLTRTLSGRVIVEFPEGELRKTASSSYLVPVRDAGVTKTRTGLARLPVSDWQLRKTSDGKLLVPLDKEEVETNTGKSVLLSFHKDALPQTRDKGVLPRQKYRLDPTASDRVLIPFDGKIVEKDAHGRVIVAMDPRQVPRCSSGHIEVAVKPGKLHPCGTLILHMDESMGKVLKDGTVGIPYKTQHLLRVSGRKVLVPVKASDLKAGSRRRKDTTDVPLPEHLLHRTDSGRILMPFRVEELRQTIPGHISLADAAPIPVHKSPSGHVYLALSDSQLQSSDSSHVLALYDVENLPQTSADSVLLPIPDHLIPTNLVGKVQVPCRAEDLARSQTGEMLVAVDDCQLRMNADGQVMVPFKEGQLKLSPCKEHYFIPYRPDQLRWVDNGTVYVPTEPQNLSRDEEGRILVPTQESAVPRSSSGAILGQYKDSDLKRTQSGHLIIPYKENDLDLTPSGQFLIPRHESELKKDENGCFLIPVHKRRVERTPSGAILVPFNKHQLLRTESGRVFLKLGVEELPSDENGYFLAPLDIWDLSKDAQGRTMVPFSLHSLQRTESHRVLVPLEKKKLSRTASGKRYLVPFYEGDIERDAMGKAFNQDNEGYYMVPVKKEQVKRTVSGRLLIPYKETTEVITERGAKLRPTVEYCLSRTVSGTPLVEYDSSNFALTPSGDFLIPYEEGGIRRSKSGTILFPKGDSSCLLNRASKSVLWQPYCQDMITLTPSGHILVPFEDDAMLRVEDRTYRPLPVSLRQNSSGKLCVEHEDKNLPRDLHGNFMIPFEEVRLKYSVMGRRPRIFDYKAKSRTKKTSAQSMQKRRSSKERDMIQESPSGTLLVARTAEELHETLDGRILVPFDFGEYPETPTGETLVPCLQGKEDQVMYTPSGHIFVPYSTSELRRTRSGLYLVPYVKSDLISIHDSLTQISEKFDRQVVYCYNDDEEIFELAVSIVQSGQQEDFHELSDHPSDEELDEQLKVILQRKQSATPTPEKYDVEALKPVWRKIQRERRKKGVKRIKVGVAKKCKCKKDFKDCGCKWHYVSPYRFQDLVVTWKEFQKIKEREQKIKIARLKQELSRKIPDYAHTYTSPYMQSGKTLERRGSQESCQGCQSGEDSSASHLESRRVDAMRRRWKLAKEWKLENLADEAGEKMSTRPNRNSKRRSVDIAGTCSDDSASDGDEVVSPVRVRRRRGSKRAKTSRDNMPPVED